MKTDFNRIAISLAFTCVVFSFQCCYTGADATKKLSGGYYYRNEGGDIKDILCEKPNGGEIPATVIAYDYDKNFIIVKQKPKTPQEPLYSKNYQYKDGIEGIYYWLIVHDKGLILGPLNEIEFKGARKQYQVPDNLKTE